MRLSDKKFYQKVATQPAPKPALSAPELFDILAQQFGPGVPQVDPNQPPVEDKVQNFKDIGLNDQQVEQVMKMADGEEEEETENAPPEAPLPPGEHDDEVPKPAPVQDPGGLLDYQHQQPSQEALEPQGPDVKDLMQGKDVQQKQQIILSFLGHVQKLHDAYMRVSEQMGYNPGPGAYVQWNKAWGQYQALQQAAQDPDSFERMERLWGEAKQISSMMEDPAIWAQVPPEHQAQYAARMKELKEQVPPQMLAADDFSVQSIMATIQEMRKGMPAQYDEAGNVTKKQQSGLGDKHEKTLQESSAGKKRLQKQLDALKIQISKAGSMYKKLFTLMQPKPAQPAKVVPERGIPGQPGYRPSRTIPAKPAEPGMPETEALAWLKQQVQEMQSFRPPMEQPMEEKPENVEIGDSKVTKVDNPKHKPAPKKKEEKESANDGNQPAGTADSPIDGQRDSLSSEEIAGTGKIGQQMPGGPGGGGEAPGGPAPAAPPMPGGDDGMAQEPGLVEEKAEDPRSLEEIMMEMKDDFDALMQKIESGETMSGGQELEPIDTDSGAMPAPAPMIAAEHVAVDNDAKEYYHDYYGEYGDAMTQDRVAEIVDMVEETATDYGVVLTNDQVARVAHFVNCGGGSIDDNYLGVLNRALISYLFKTGMVFTAQNLPLDRSFCAHLTDMAVQSLPPNLISKMAEYAKLADSKMKKPKINQQQPDAEKVDHLKDKAKDGDEMLARPAHALLELDDHHVDGAYLKLEIKWDPDDEAAKRSDDGLKHMVLTFVKGMESKKEFVDIGFLGQPSFEEFDAEAGLATVRVRTKKPGDAPLSVRDV